MNPFKWEQNRIYLSDTIYFYFINALCPHKMKFPVILVCISADAPCGTHKITFISNICRRRQPLVDPQSLSLPDSTQILHMAHKSQPRHTDSPAVGEEILVRMKHFGFAGFALLVTRNSTANYTKIKCMNNSNGCCGQQPETRRRGTALALAPPKLIIQKDQKDLKGRRQMWGNWVSCFVFTLHFIALTLWHNEYKYLDSKNSSNGMYWSCRTWASARPCGRMCGLDRRINFNIKWNAERQLWNCTWISSDHFYVRLTGQFFRKNAYDISIYRPRSTYPVRLLKIERHCLVYGRF